VRIHAIFGGIGAIAVKFRWVVIAAWLIAGFAVPKLITCRYARQSAAQWVPPEPR
jgi:hypothetical protein